MADQQKLLPEHSESLQVMRLVQPLESPVEQPGECPSVPWSSSSPQQTKVPSAHFELNSGLGFNRPSLLWLMRRVRGFQDGQVFRKRADILYPLCDIRSHQTEAVWPGEGRWLGRLLSLQGNGFLVTALS